MKKAQFVDNAMQFYLMLRKNVQYTWPNRYLMKVAFLTGCSISLTSLSLTSTL